MDSDQRKLPRPPKGPPPVPPKQDDERPPARAMLAWVVVFGMILAMVVALSSGPRGYQELPNEAVFRQMVEAGQVDKCELVREVSGKTLIRGTTKKGNVKGAKLPQRFFVSVMPDTEELRAYLRQHDVSPKVTYQNPVWGEILAQLLPVVLFLGLLYFIFMRQMRSAGMGAMNFGKSRARMLNRDKQKVTFENVAGIEEAKEEVQEIIEFLKAPQKFTKLGGR
ncbi:MAG: hypothetical protein PHR35_17265, partial [Kiritimatiellae bacterium]|nr:hypothetical protein [Kiritimatiellia bacterium]